MDSTDERRPKPARRGRTAIAAAALASVAVVALVVMALAGCGSSGSPAPVAGTSAAQGKRLQRSPTAHGRQAAIPGPPAAGVCPRATPKKVVTVRLDPDVPSPRCLVVAPRQELRLLNRSGAFHQTPESVTVHFAGFDASIAPDQAAILDEPFGAYLQPGTHQVTVRGASGGPSLRVLSGNSGRRSGEPPR